jgi:hypothetical protein
MKFAQLCLKRHAEKRPAIGEDVIDFMWEFGLPVDRFWGNRFIGRSVPALSLRQAIILEEDRHNLITNDVKRYFDRVQDHQRAIPLMLIWSAGETRLGSLRKQQVPVLITSASIGLALSTVPEARDHPQHTLLTAISAFRDSIPSLFLSKNKIFETNCWSSKRYTTGTITQPELLRRLSEMRFYSWAG